MHPIEIIAVELRSVSLRNGTICDVQLYLLIGESPLSAALRFRSNFVVSLPCALSELSGPAYKYPSIFVFYLFGIDSPRASSKRALSLCRRCRRQRRRRHGQTAISATAHTKSPGQRTCTHFSRINAHDPACADCNNTVAITLGLMCNRSRPTKRSIIASA